MFRGESWVGERGVGWARRKEATEGSGIGGKGICLAGVMLSSSGGFWGVQLLTSVVMLPSVTITKTGSPGGINIPAERC